MGPFRAFVPFDIFFIQSEIFGNFFDNNGTRTGENVPDWLVPNFFDGYI